MSNYKRIYLPNRSFFFTVVTYNRRKLFVDDENIQLLKTAIRYVQSRKTFKIDAICILPDHLHCVWTIGDNSNYSVRWQMIKTQFSRQFRHRNPCEKTNKIWQPRYWEHMIRNQTDMLRHIDYIHYNPVKHGLVESVKDWPYSSFCNYLELGYYEKGWGDTEPEGLVDINCE